MQAGDQLLATMESVAMTTPASWDTLSEDSPSGDIRLAGLIPVLDLGSVYQASPQHSPCGGRMSDLVPRHCGQVT